MLQDGLGLRGLNKGLTATIGRNGTFNMIYFGFYHSVKEHFPAYEVRICSCECVLLRIAEYLTHDGRSVIGGNAELSLCRNSVSPSIHYLFECSTFNCCY